MWEYVSDVPKVSPFCSYICAFMNVVLPGSGTILASCYSSSNYVSKTQIIIGLHQFITALLIIGWIWSIYWGYLIVMKAKDDEKIMRQNFPDDSQANVDGGFGAEMNNRQRIAQQYQQNPKQYYTSVNGNQYYVQ